MKLTHLSPVQYCFLKTQSESIYIRMKRQEAAFINIKLKVQKGFLNLNQILKLITNFGTDSTIRPTHCLSVRIGPYLQCEVSTLAILVWAQ
jgi:hypothetical protein